MEHRFGGIVCADKLQFRFAASAIVGLILGSVSRARYKRPKGNFLLGVITRSCVHTSSATFPQLLAQLASRSGFAVNCCTRVRATNRRDSTWLPIDQLANPATNSLLRFWKCFIAQGMNNFSMEFLPLLLFLIIASNYVWFHEFLSINESFIHATFSSSSMCFISNFLFHVYLVIYSSDFKSETVRFFSRRK